MRRKGANRGCLHGKLPANTLLVAPGSVTALALIYRAKLLPDMSLQFPDGVGIALLQHSDSYTESPFVAGKSERESPKSYEIKKRDTMKEERMHAKLHGETGYR